MPRMKTGRRTMVLALMEILSGDKATVAEKLEAARILERVNQPKPKLIKEKPAPQKPVAKIPTLLG